MDTILKGLPLHKAARMRPRLDNYNVGVSMNGSFLFECAQVRVIDFKTILCWVIFNDSH